MADLRVTQRRWRNRLPHWEVEGAVFFVTIRCYGSLPEEVVNRVREIRTSMDEVESESEQYLVTQRQMFLTCEKYLDTGCGFAPFKSSKVAERFMKILEEWALGAGWSVPVYCVMPNHVHFLGEKLSDSALDLREFVKRLKGRSARELNLCLRRSGTFWQGDWFDRWIRSEAELGRVSEYILNNPVKAGIVGRVDEYEFSKGSVDAG